MPPVFFCVGGTKHATLFRHRPPCYTSGVEQSPTERRSRPRIAIMGVGHVRIEGSDVTREMYLANISDSGLGVYLRRRVSRDKQVFLSFRNRQVETSARVMWTEAAGQLHMAGLRFVSVAPEVVRALLEAVQ